MYIYFTILAISSYFRLNNTFLNISIFLNYNNNLAVKHVYLYFNMYIVVKTMLYICIAKKILLVLKI